MREFDPMTPNESGELSKQRVCTDLLNRGFKVFRAVGLPSGCDFVVLPDKLRVKVKTARRIRDKYYIHKPRNDNYDVIAKVLPDKIIYEPSLNGR